MTVRTFFSRQLNMILVAGMLVAAASTAGVSAAFAADHGGGAGQPDLGGHVYVVHASMPLSQIEATVNAVASQQVSNQFGTQRYALLFKPGTYGSAANPLSFQVGYYTAVAGLGLSPNDVVINGSIDVYKQHPARLCTALHNFL